MSELRVVVCITAASGVVYGVRLLEVLRESQVEVDLVVSSRAEPILKHEAEVEVGDLAKLATNFYKDDDLTAPISSGSTPFDGVVIAPCSMKSLAGVANGYSDNLILRAADVALKERRKLILVVRETPLNMIHLENMIKAARAGALIMPASPAFYHKPRQVRELVDFIVGKVLDQFEIPHSLYKRWRA